VAHLGGLEVDLVAVEVVAAVEVPMEVAEDGTFEGDTAALQAVGLDVATDGDLHLALLWRYPPRGVALLNCMDSYA
jgi:hypothetical protein